MTYVFLASSQEAEQAANFADFQYTIKDLLYLWLYCLWFKSMGNAHQSSERSCNTASSSNDRRVNGFWIVHSHKVLLLLITWVTWQAVRDHGALSGMYMHVARNLCQLIMLKILEMQELTTSQLLSLEYFLLFASTLDGVKKHDSTLNGWRYLRGCPCYHWMHNDCLKCVVDCLW